MEGYLTYYYEYHFLYITGIEHVESKNIQGVALMKLVFHPEHGHEPGDGGSGGLREPRPGIHASGRRSALHHALRRGQRPRRAVVFSSPPGPPGNAGHRFEPVRPIFATLPGVSAPPPFGGTADHRHPTNPEKLRRSGSPLKSDPRREPVHYGAPVWKCPRRRADTYRIDQRGPRRQHPGTAGCPMRLGAGPTVYLRDIGSITDGTDIIVGYAHVNGRRTVYIPVTKRADALHPGCYPAREGGAAAYACGRSRGCGHRSRLRPVRVRGQCAREPHPGGIARRIADRLMVLLFLRISPPALLSSSPPSRLPLLALVLLRLSGGTINIMTLAVSRWRSAYWWTRQPFRSRAFTLTPMRERRRPRRHRSLEKTALPRLLSMLCVLAVFIPSFFMTGIGRQAFVPLSLAVGFAMLPRMRCRARQVPCLSASLIKAHRGRRRGRPRRAPGFYRNTSLALRFRSAAGRSVYGCHGGTFHLPGLPPVGAEIFPSAESRQVQIRLRAPAGTRIDAPNRLH